MRNRLFTITIIAAFTGMLILGLVTRGSHTDVVHQDDFMDCVVVAELPDELSEMCFNIDIDNWDSAAYILKVKATADLDFYGYAGSQEVEIVDIVKGEGLNRGQRISLTTESWRLDIEKDSVALGRGFINIMDIGKEYLVFGQTISDVYWKEIPVMTLLDVGMVAPVFGYQDGESLVAEHDEYSSYVRYNMVGNNEFFGESIDTIEAWNEMKHQILGMYAIEIR